MMYRQAENLGVVQTITPRSGNDDDLLLHTLEIEYMSKLDKYSISL
jgi:hypothetical protein